MNRFLLCLTLVATVISPVSVMMSLASAQSLSESVVDTELSARLEEGDRLLNQGVQQVQIGHYEEAMISWQEALNIFQDARVRNAFPEASLIGEAKALGNLGIAYFNLGEYQKAIGYYEQQLAIAREVGDRIGERNALVNSGNAHSNLGQYQQAIDLYEQSLGITRTVNEPGNEGDILNNLGRVYQNLGQYQQAISLYEESLEIARNEANQSGEGKALGNLGDAYQQLGQYQQSLDFWQQALAIAREIRNPGTESWILKGLGDVYFRLSQYQEAIGFYEEALEITREIGTRHGEGDALQGLGNVYSYQGQYQQAIEFYEQSLTISLEVGDRAGEGGTLGNLGLVYNNLGQYRQAIDFSEQSLAIAREIGNRLGESNALGNLGIAYSSLGQYQQAINVYEQQLVITQAVGNRAGESGVFGNLGIVYSNLGQYQQAISLFEQALVITREIGDRTGEATTLGNIGAVNHTLSRYQQAINFHEQHLALAREISDRASESDALGNLGIVYSDLGQYQQAISFYEQQLIITREIGNHAKEGNALGNLGVVYAKLGQYQIAIDFYEQQLEITREIEDRAAEGAALGNLGVAHRHLRLYQQAVEFHEQALTIAREIGDRAREGTALGNLGATYEKISQYQSAIDFYQQAIAITQEIGDHAGEGYWLSNFGYLLAQQNQPELAIIFYKQSVNVWESIRDDIKGLPSEQQQSFLDTVASSYRFLADLLLQQDRILEAQRVLDLLKVQELDDYLQSIRGNAQTQSGIDLANPETQISNRTILVGRKLAELQAIPFTELSEAQLNELETLQAEQQAIINDFQGFIASSEIQVLIDQLSVDVREQDMLAELDEFINLQNNLQAIDRNAVMIYPLILDDRLELVLVTPFSEPTRYPVDVDRETLNKAIVEFRQALTNPRSQPEAIAHQLYQWLIEPMTADLEAIGAETILYAPDGVLRYVPLAALHDGEQWLTQRFAINHITAASLSDFAIADRSDPKVLAAAFSEGFHEVEVGDRIFPLNGLPFAGTEVTNLANLFAENSTALFDNDFSRRLTELAMGSHNIVHLATHAAFVSGSPSDSFILFGNGDIATLEDIKSWEGRFNQVDLFVLSACETGLGGEDLGNGEEILGFGYLMQQAGAKAAIASLWSVSDGGTQVLMDAFYSALNNGYSKTEALQRAQQALITGDEMVLAGERGMAIELIDSRVGQSLHQSANLDHPYYWAPFILIGNGL